MDSQNSDRPQLSSSVSMFIEDARKAVNENPGYYTEVWTRPLNSDGNVQSWRILHSLGSSGSSICNANFERKLQQLPLFEESSVNCSGLGSSSSLSSSTSRSSVSSVGGPLRSSRSVIHRPIKESSLEDEENVHFIESAFESEPQRFYRQRYNSSLPSSRHGSVSTRRHSSISSTTSLPVEFERKITFSERGTLKSNYRTTILNIQPSSSFVNVKETFPSSNQCISDDRTFTSVNLTLRSPSVENKSFISPTTSSLNLSEGPSICSCGSSIRVLPLNSNTMTYSTYSSAGDGFQAQVQIQIGPNGGTISASRRRKENGEMQQMNADLISAQAERKEKLHVTLIAEKSHLTQLQQEIIRLRSTLHPLFDDLEKLKDENQRLRIECQLMTREVDLYDNGTVPLGETSEEFYRDIYPGQDVNALFGSTNNRRRRHGVEPGGPYVVPRKPPPPRPPPPNPKLLPSPLPELGTNAEWTCSKYNMVLGTKQATKPNSNFS